MRPLILSSNSFWYAAPPFTTYTSQREEILVGPLQLNSVPFGDDLALAGGGKFIFKTARQLYGRFESLQSIADHRAAVLLPYAVLSYGITELYAANVPIFVPTPKFLLRLGLMVDWRMRDKFYCGEAIEVPPKHAKSSHPFTPEFSLNDTEAQLYWVQFADFYTWPYIQQFSSWDDLIEQLSLADFRVLHDNLARSNSLRKKDLVTEWRKVINMIPPGRQVPTSYPGANFLAQN